MKRSLPLAILAGLAAGWWCGDTIPSKSSTPSRVAVIATHH